MERSLTGRCPSSLRGSDQLGLLGDSLLSAELDSLSDTMGAVGGCDPRSVPSSSQDDQVGAHRWSVGHWAWNELSVCYLC